MLPPLWCPSCNPVWAVDENTGRGGAGDPKHPLRLMPTGPGTEAGRGSHTDDDDDQIGRLLSLGSSASKSLKSAAEHVDSSPSYPESSRTPKSRPDERQTRGQETQAENVLAVQILKMDGRDTASRGILRPYFLKSTMTRVQTLGFSFDVIPAKARPHSTLLFPEICSLGGCRRATHRMPHFPTPKAPTGALIACVSFTMNSPKNSLLK